MVNKRGWLKIVEATTAVIIILTAAFLVYSSLKPTTTKDNTIPLSDILEKIAQNSSLRNRILSYNLESPTEFDNETKQQIRSFLSKEITSSILGYDIEICEKEDICPLTAKIDSISLYSSSRLISSNVSEFSPRKLKLFVWQKN
jgi:hypothetical protein